MEKKEVVQQYIKHLAKNLNDFEKKNIKLESEKKVFKKEITNLEIKKEFISEKEKEMKKLLISTIKKLASDRFFILKSDNKLNFDKKICDFLQNIFYEENLFKNKNSLKNEKEIFKIQVENKLGNFLKNLMKNDCYDFKIIGIEEFLDEKNCLNINNSLYANKNFVLVLKFGIKFYV